MDSLQRIGLLNGLSDAANHLLVVWIVAGSKPMTAEGLAVLVGRAYGTTQRALQCLHAHGLAVHPHYRQWQLTGAWRQLSLAETSKLDVSYVLKRQSLGFETSKLELSADNNNNKNKEDDKRAPALLQIEAWHHAEIGEVTPMIASLLSEWWSRCPSLEKWRYGFGAAAAHNKRSTQYVIKCVKTFDDERQQLLRKIRR